MFEMSQTLIKHNINLPSEKMAPLKSQNLLQKLSAGNTLRSLRSESSFSGEKKNRSGWHYHFSHADCTSIFQKTISSEAWQTAQRKGGKGGDGAILSPVTFSVPHYLLLFRVERQLPVESSHALMHRKFLIVHPLKTMTFKYTEWYGTPVALPRHCTVDEWLQEEIYLMPSCNRVWFHTWKVLKRYEAFAEQCGLKH